MRKKPKPIDTSLISQNPVAADKFGLNSNSTADEGDDRLLRVDEAARLLGVAVGTLYHMASERRVPCVRLSARALRFSLTEILKWLAELKVPATNEIVIGRQKATPKMRRNAGDLV